MEQWWWPYNFASQRRSGGIFICILHHVLKNTLVLFVWKEVRVDRGDLNCHCIFSSSNVGELVDDFRNAAPSARHFPRLSNHHIWLFCLEFYRLSMGSKQTEQCSRVSQS